MSREQAEGTGSLEPAIWIASYPRSGSMYLRSLIANFRSGLDQPLPLDRVIDLTIGEHDEAVLSELIGKPPVERSAEEEWAARTSYFARMRRQRGGNRPMIKSHTLNGEIAGKPAFSFIPGDRVIHLVRHPCEVAISFTHFYRIDAEKAVEWMTRPGLCLDGLPNAGYEIVGSWAQHTRSWLGEVAAPVYRLSYAQLVSQAADVLNDIVGFLGFEPDHTRAKLAAEFSDFQQLRRQEHQHGFAEHRRAAETAYFRKGLSGNWRAGLRADLAARLLDYDRELVEAFAFAT